MTEFFCKEDSLGPDANGKKLGLTLMPQLEPRVMGNERFSFGDMTKSASRNCALAEAVGILKGATSFGPLCHPRQEQERLRSDFREDDHVCALVVDSAASMTTFHLALGAKYMDFKVGLVPISECAEWKVYCTPDPDDREYYHILEYDPELVMDPAILYVVSDTDLSAALEDEWVTGGSGIDCVFLDVCSNVTRGLLNVYPALLGINKRRGGVFGVTFCVNFHPPNEKNIHKKFDPQRADFSIFTDIGYWSSDDDQWDYACRFM